MKDIDNLINKYLDELKLAKLKRKRITIVKSFLKKIKDFIVDENIPLHTFGVKEALQFQSQLTQTKLAKASVNRTIAETSSFFGFLKREGIVLTNPFSEIRRIREGRKLPKGVLKEKQMSQFLDELSHFNKGTDLWEKIKRYKVHVIAELQYSTGMRISEVAELKVSDIDFDRGVVNVIDAKTSRLRKCFLNEYAKEILRLYVTRMRHWVFNAFNFENGSLFGATVDRMNFIVNSHLKKTSKNLGLPVVRSHGFRHAFGAHLLRAGCDMRYIQLLLGHQRLKTTQVYTKIDKEDLRAVLDKFHPRKWSKDA